MEQSAYTRLLKGPRHCETEQTTLINTNNNRNAGIMFCLSILMVMLLNLVSMKAHGQVYFSDNFESGNLDKWDSLIRYGNSYFPDINPTPWSVASGIGGNPSHMLYLHYLIPDDGTLPKNPVSVPIPKHFDENYAVEKNLASLDINHFFLRGCFYLKKPARRSLETFGRKMFYLFSADHNGTAASGKRWDLIINVDGGRNIRLRTPNGSYVTKFSPLHIRMTANYRDFNDLGKTSIKVGKGDISYNTWECMEVELKLNTPGDPPPKDGYVKLWLNGDLLIDRDNISIRKSDKPLGRVRVGAQIDRRKDAADDNLKRESSRYWDDIVVSSTRNGTANVIGHSDNLVPPSGLKIYGMDNE